MEYEIRTGKGEIVTVLRGFGCAALTSALDVSQVSVLMAYGSDYALLSRHWECFSSFCRERGLVAIQNRLIEISCNPQTLAISRGKPHENVTLNFEFVGRRGFEEIQYCKSRLSRIFIIQKHNKNEM